MDSLEGKVKSLGKHQKYRKNSLLFSAQEEAKGFYYVQSGEIRVFKMDETGREVELARIHAGDFFGEAIALSALRYPAFAQATKETEVLFFEKRAFFKALEKDPALAKFFLGLLARKCLVLSERIESLGLKTVRQRLAQYLLSQCSGDRACLIELKLKKGELAKLLGTVSETLSRNLRDLQEEGVIEVKDKKIHVKDCPRLREELSC